MTTRVRTVDPIQQARDHAQRVAGVRSVRDVDRAQRETARFLDRATPLAVVTVDALPGVDSQYYGKVVIVNGGTGVADTAYVLLRQADDTLAWAQIDNASGAGGVTVQEEGSTLATLGTTINFVGAGVTASGAGATKTVTISGGSGGGAPVGASYITQTPDATLSAEQALSALATGVLKVTTGTGVLSAATGSDLPAHAHNAADVTDFAESVDDRVAALVVGANGITDAYNDGAGTLTIAPTYGAAANTITEGNDARLSNARTPTAHGHAPGDITGTAVVTGDVRLSDARTPTAHTHPASDVAVAAGDVSTATIAKVVKAGTAVGAASFDQITPNDLAYMSAPIPATDGLAFRGNTATGLYEAVPSVYETEVDFGTTPTRDKRFSVANAAIKATSLILISQSGTIPSDGFGAEAELDPIHVSARALAGQMLVYCTPLAGKVVGKYRFVYSLG